MSINFEILALNVQFIYAIRTMRIERSPGKRLSGQ